MLGELTRPEIEKVLHEQVLGRIGCCADNQAYIIPLAFAYDGQYLYGHSREGRKINMMRKNPRVCFEVDVVENLANWQSVIVQGEYEELLGDAARKAMQLFMEDLQPHLLSKTSVPSHGMGQFHVKEQSGVKSVVFRIKVLEKTGRFEKQKG